MGNQTSSNPEKAQASDKTQVKEVIIRSPMSQSSKSPRLKPETDFKLKSNESKFKGSTQKESTEVESATTTNSLEADNKVAVCFVWREGGNMVYLTGSFSNWSQIFVMTKANNNFELTLVKLLLIFRNCRKEFTSTNLWSTTFGISANTIQLAATVAATSTT